MMPAQRDMPPPWMHAVSATQFVRQHAKWSEAARTAPVAIERHGTPGLVVMAFSEWRRMDEQNRLLLHELRYLRALCDMHGAWTFEEQETASAIAEDAADMPSQWYGRMPGVISRKA